MVEPLAGSLRLADLADSLTESDPMTDSTDCESVTEINQLKYQRRDQLQSMIEAAIPSLLPEIAALVVSHLWAMQVLLPSHTSNGTCLSLTPLQQTIPLQQHCKRDCKSKSNCKGSESSYSRSITDNYVNEYVVEHKQEYSLSDVPTSIRAEYFVGMSVQVWSVQIDKCSWGLQASATDGSGSVCVGLCASASGAPGVQASERKFEQPDTGKCNFTGGEQDQSQTQVHEAGCDLSQDDHNNDRFQQLCVGSPCMPSIVITSDHCALVVDGELETEMSFTQRSVAQGITRPCRRSQVHCTTDVDCELSETESDCDCGWKFGEMFGLWDIGDVIGVECDLIRGCVTFLHNSKQIGTVFHPKLEAMYPFISLPSRCQVTVTF